VTLRHNTDKLGVSNYQIKRGGGSRLRHRDYTIDRLEVMAEKAEKMLLKIINE